VKITKVLVIALSAGTLFAQAPTQELDSRIQIFGELIRPTSYTLGNGAGQTAKDQAGRSWGVGMRFMGEIASARNWYYELGGKLDSSSQLAYNAGGTNLTDIKITHSYWSVGAGYLAPLGSAFSLGFHLEGRGETMAAQGAIQTNGVVSNRVDAGNTALRPWGRLSLDGSWHMGSLHPYVGVDVAATPVKTTQTAPISDLSQLDNRTLRSMAPNVAGSVYVGLHF
jgi:hypothetical protein